MINIFFKCLFIAITGILLNLILKSTKNQFVTFVTICATVLICILVLTMLKPIIDFVFELCSYLVISDTYVKIVLKSIGIALICDYTVCLCKDFSENTLAYCTELAAKLTIISISIPMYKDIINIILSLWEKR